MRKLLFIAMFFHFCGTGRAQEKADAVVDSLLTAVNTIDPSRSDVKSYNQAASQIYRGGMPSDQDDFLRLLTTIVKIAQKQGDKKELATANYNLGKYHISAYSSYSKAIPALLRGLTLFEEVKDSLGVSRCYMQLGLIGYTTQYFEDGIKNFKLSLKYYDNPTSIYLMAITYTELGNFAEAKKQFLIAIKSYTKLKRKNSLNECYMYLGKLYVDEGKLDSAHYYLKKAIKNQNSPLTLDELSRPYALISCYFLKNNELDSARYYAHTALTESQNNHDDLSAMLASETLSKVYELEEDFEKAHKYLQLHYKLVNESVQGSTKQKLAEMQSMFDFKKQMAEENLKHEEQMRLKNRSKNIFLVSGLFVLVMAGGLWSRLQYVRKSKAALQNEKNVSENLLLNILPEEIALELKEKGSADARNFEMVSILFTDFKSFTEQSAKLSATDLVAEINHCFEAFDHIIEKYDIEKIKTIGDAYMAAGGLPVPTDDSVKNTVLAALEMQDFIVKRKNEFDAQISSPLGRPGGARFEMRVGIHTGPVVAGIVGVKKFQYDIWGDTVNTANRIENNGEVGKVNISQATYTLLQSDPDFTFESRGKIEAKGKGEIDMWFVQLKKGA